MIFHTIKRWYATLEDTATKLIMMIIDHVSNNIKTRYLTLENINFKWDDHG